MTLQEKFLDSKNKIKGLKSRPDNTELLELYSLYKQATVGDNNEKKPSALMIKDSAKWKAWKEKEGQSQESAMEEYITTVDKLISNYGVK